MYRNLKAGWQSFPGKLTQYSPSLRDIYNLKALKCVTHHCITNYSKNIAAENSKYLLSDTVSWGQESGSDIAGWFCPEFLWRLSQTVRAAVYEDVTALQDLFPSSVTWLVRRLQFLATQASPQCHSRHIFLQSEWSKKENESERER